MISVAVTVTDELKVTECMQKAVVVMTTQVARSIAITQQQSIRMHIAAAKQLIVRMAHRIAKEMHTVKVRPVAAAKDNVQPTRSVLPRAWLRVARTRSPRIARPKQRIVRPAHAPARHAARLLNPNVAVRRTPVAVTPVVAAAEAAAAVEAAIPAAAVAVEVIPAVEAAEADTPEEVTQVAVAAVAAVVAEVIADKTKKGGQSTILFYYPLPINYYLLP